MIGQAKMFSAVAVEIAPYVCGSLLVGTVAHGIGQGWLIETTVATVAARVVLLWIPAIWVSLSLFKPQGKLGKLGKLGVCIITLVVVAVPVIIASLIGIKMSVELALLMLLVRAAT